MAIFTESPHKGMDKKGIRAAFRERRRHLSPEAAAEGQRLILALFRGCSLPPVHCLHRYVADPRGGEPDPAPLAEWMKTLNPGMVVAMPRISNDDHVMRAVVCDGSTTMAANRWGIPEPVAGTEVGADRMDMVLVPLVAFDVKGHRVGHGKGYYDRFLKDCRTDCIKLGLSFFEPVGAIGDAEAHDVRLDLCITPHRVYEFD